MCSQLRIRCGKTFHHYMTPALWCRMVLRLRMIRYLSRMSCYLWLYKGIRSSICTQNHSTLLLPLLNNYGIRITHSLNDRWDLSDYYTHTKQSQSWKESLRFDQDINNICVTGSIQRSYQYPDKKEDPIGIKLKACRYSYLINRILICFI